MFVWSIAYNTQNVFGSGIGTEPRPSANIRYKNLEIKIRGKGLYPLNHMKL